MCGYVAEWWLRDNRTPQRCRTCYRPDDGSLRWLWVPGSHVYVKAVLRVPNLLTGVYKKREVVRYAPSGSPLCAHCREVVYYADYDALEKAWCDSVKRGRTGDRRWLRGIPLKNIVQNTPEWMRARFGPDLLRIGASRAGDVVGSSTYGDPLAFYKMLRGQNDQLRWEIGGRSAPTEMGHAYEDFVARLVELCYPELHIREGDIRVPEDEALRKRFAVSVDGYVYLREEMQRDDELAGFQGCFEAKCSYFKAHDAQARDESPHKNPNRDWGVKAVHVAQVHMQNWVVKAPWTIYCTVKWCKWMPPHPQLGIPPFESVCMVKVHTSQRYLDEFLVPQLVRFAKAVRGETCWVPPQPYPYQTPPEVKMEDLLAPGSRGKARLNRLSAQLLFWRTQHQRRAKLLGDWVLQEQRLQEKAGEEVDYSVWY